MCGFVGGTNIERHLMERAIDSIRHRGPDAIGYWRSDDGHLSLGHARLSIIDLDVRATQPMLCAKKENIIVFNGEIYNHKAIRKELEVCGWHFKTTSDTEVLLNAYGEWGEKCLERLNGMFAFVIYEPRNERLFLARDRVGKKPIYYSLYNDQIVFGSEIKALFAAHPDIPREIDPHALKEYCDLGYIPGEMSIYKAIRKLGSAHCLRYDLTSGTLTTERYWLPSIHEADDVDEESAAEELEALIADSVRLRLECDVPVGVFLSGGLDSSLVSAFVARENQGIVAYTAKFPIAKYDESSYAASLAKHLSVNHCVVPVNAADIGTLEWLLTRLDEPLGDSSILPTYLISKAISEHVKVVLSGDGGDELFGGYDYYALVLREQGLSRLPTWLRVILSQTHWAIPVGTKGKNFLRRMRYEGIEKFLFVTAYPEYVAEIPLKQPLSEIISSIPNDCYRRRVLEVIKSLPGIGTSLLKRMTLLDFLTYLPDDILVKVDRASMLASLEVRSPLLDYRIVEFAFRLPDRLRVNGGIRKYLIRRIARKYLPPDFPYDRKQGFSIPETEWFKGDWRDSITRNKVNGFKLIDVLKLHALHKRHNSSGRYGKLLFRVLALCMMEKSANVAL